MSEIIELSPGHPLSPILKAEQETLSLLSSEEIKEEILKSLELTVRQVARLSVCIRILEERGEDISEIRFGLVGYLRKIAYGQMLPEVIVAFQGHPLLLEKTAALSIPDQVKISSGSPVEVADFSDDKKISHRLIQPSRLSRDEIHQVLAKDHIRDVNEQVSFLRSRKPKRKRVEKTGISVDAERCGITVNGEFISRSDLAQYLAKLT